MQCGRQTGSCYRGERRDRHDQQSRFQQRLLEELDERTTRVVVDLNAADRVEKIGLSALRAGEALGNASTGSWPSSARWLGAPCPRHHRPGRDDRRSRHARGGTGSRGSGAVGGVDREVGALEELQSGERAAGLRLPVAAQSSVTSVPSPRAETRRSSAPTSAARSRIERSPRCVADTGPGRSRSRRRGSGGARGPVRSPAPPRRWPRRSGARRCSAPPGSRGRAPCAALAAAARRRARSR